MKRLEALGLSTLFIVLMQNVGPAQQAPPSAPLHVTDVSPDAPFGTPQDSNGVDPSGRILGIVVDPTNDSTLYAASKYSGIWKSEDGGRTWHQASSGLRNGYTSDVYQIQLGQLLQYGAPVLAIDTLSPGRLLYATYSDDGRPQTPYGGLWVSIDYATSWHHIDLCAQLAGQGLPATQTTWSVVFSGAGLPFVATDCGLWSTTDFDLTDEANWQRLDTGVVNPQFFSGATLAASSTGLLFFPLFACNGGVLVRSVNPFTSPPAWDIQTLPGACQGLAIPPQDPLEMEASTALVAYQTNQPSTLKPNNTEVCVANFKISFGDTCLSSILNFSQFSDTGGSGRRGVFVAPFRSPLKTGPLNSYDIYASDGKHFFRFHLNFEWQELTPLHVDPWSMAFPTAYDPYNGNCTAYAANDGGVFANPISGVGNCITDAAENGWILASSGLHAYSSEAMAGLSQPSSTCLAISPCPILYDPSADDEVWVSASGGVVGWQDLQAKIGDAGEVFIDPALPTQVVSGRFGGGGCQITLQTSNNGAPVTPVNANSVECVQPPNFAGGVQTPRLGGFSQVMTHPNESPLPQGDYFSYESPFALNKFSCPSGSTSCDDLIVRNTTAISDGGGWEDISPTVHFDPGSIGQIAASGSHSNPTIYVLTSNVVDVHVSPFPGRGFLWRGQIDSTGRVHLWLPASGIFPRELVQGYNLIVDPYDESELYATDLGDGTIKVSHDAGATWDALPVLKDLATNHSEFVFGCGEFANGLAGITIFQAACPLVDVAFNRDHPEIRVAALFPGGIAFSRDSGQHWIPLHVTNADPFGSPQVFDLIEMPRAVFYDPEPNPFGGSASIYVALQGKGVTRIDGPFSTLMSGQAVYCPTCASGATGSPFQVVLVVSSLGVSVPLHPGPNGLFNGDFVFDSAKNTSFSYYFTVNGVPTQTFDKILSAAEIVSGVASVSIDTTPPVIFPKILGTLGNNGWYTSTVTITWSVMDAESGIVSSSGCSPSTLTADTTGVPLTCAATNGAGLSSSVPITIKIDKTAPVISGMPAAGCTLWPPNHKLVKVAMVTATDAVAGLLPGSFSVSGTSNEPSDPKEPDIEVTGDASGGFVVQLRAERSGNGTGRTYTLTATAIDLAGNAAISTAQCTVPHDQGQ